MASWLKTLSAVFVVAGVGGGAYLLFEDKDRNFLSGEALKLRPAIDEFVGQGKVALQTLVESAKGAGKTPGRDPVPEIDQAKLPFIVIEPRDFAAPLVRLPAQPRIQPSEQLSQQRLTSGAGPLTMDFNPVEARLRARVPAELIGYFDLFLYVSKAKSDRGEWAQRMFVLAKPKEQREAFTLLYDWPVSTGREELMPAPSGKMLATDTPQGVFKLDRDRFHRDYTSRQWQSPMPYAMFFDWRTEGRTSGLAIHGTDEEGAKTLGERASHGCIRLSPENARALFELIQTGYRGRVPKFQVDPDSGTMSTAGALVRDEDGNVKMTYGYKALVFIEDFGGPSVDTVAALY